MKPDDEVALTEKLTALGYAIDRWDHHLGADEALHAAEHLRDETSLPKGYEIHEINADTPDAIIVELASVGAEQGVMVPATHVMRGTIRPASIMYITAPNSRIVAIAGSVLPHHRDSSLAASAWWGMLCTHPDHRGKGLSKFSAQEPCWRWPSVTAPRAFTPGFAARMPSRKRCARGLGFDRTDYAVLMAMNVAGGGRRAAHPVIKTMA